MGVSQKFISLGLVSLFLLVLAASGPHRVHHLEQEFQILLGHSAYEHHAHENHEGHHHGDHPEDAGQEHSACVLATAGQCTHDKKADDPVLIHAANEANPVVLQETFLVRHFLFFNLSPRAPPFPVLSYANL